MIKRESIQYSSIAVYILAYSLLTLWLLFDGLLRGFSAMTTIWSLPHDYVFPPTIQYLFFSVCGSLLGTSALGIVNLHKYSIDEETGFDHRHCLGYYLAPLLGIIFGLIGSLLVQSGVIVLNGHNSKAQASGQVGFIIIGFLSGYGWKQFVSATKHIISKMFDAKSHANIKTTPEDVPSSKP